MRRFQLCFAWLSPVRPHHLTHLDQTLPAMKGVTEALQKGPATLLLDQLQGKKEKTITKKNRTVDVTEVFMNTFLGKR